MLQLSEFQTAACQVLLEDYYTDVDTTTHRETHEMQNKMFVFVSSLMKIHDSSSIAGHTVCPERLHTRETPFQNSMHEGLNRGRLC